MFNSELKRLLDGTDGVQSAYDSLILIAGELATRRITSEDVFFNNTEPAERTLFAISGIILVAGANGNAL